MRLEGIYRPFPLFRSSPHPKTEARLFRFRSLFRRPKLFPAKADSSASEDQRIRFRRSTHPLRKLATFGFFKLFSHFPSFFPLRLPNFQNPDSRPILTISGRYSSPPLRRIWSSKFRLGRHILEDNFASILPRLITPLIKKHNSFVYPALPSFAHG